VQLQSCHLSYHLLMMQIYDANARQRVDWFGPSFLSPRAGPNSAACFLWLFGGIAGEHSCFTVDLAVPADAWGGVPDQANMHCVFKPLLHAAMRALCAATSQINTCLSFQSNLVLPYAIVMNTHEESSQDSVPLLQVFLWLTEATADSKESRWNCIREKLGHEVCQSQDQVQHSQQQQSQQQQSQQQQSQQQQQQEQKRTPVQGLGLQAGLVQQPAGAGPIMPAPAHLGLQAAKLTDAEKTRSAVYADHAAGFFVFDATVSQMNNLG